MPASYEQAITLAGDLHARPAGALAVAAGQFAAAVSLTVGERSADAKSVLAVMGLGATSGQHVTAHSGGTRRGSGGGGGDRHPGRGDAGRGVTALPAPRHRVPVQAAFGAGAGSPLPDGQAEHVEYPLRAEPADRRAEPHPGDLPGQPEPEGGRQVGAVGVRLGEGQRRIGVRPQHVGHQRPGGIRAATRRSGRRPTAAAASTPSGPAPSGPAPRTRGPGRRTRAGRRRGPRRSPRHPAAARPRARLVRPRIPPPRPAATRPPPARSSPSIRPQHVRHPARPCVAGRGCDGSRCQMPYRTPSSVNPSRSYTGRPSSVAVSSTVTTPACRSQSMAAALTAVPIPWPRASGSTATLPSHAGPAERHRVGGAGHPVLLARHDDAAAGAGQVEVQGGRLAGPEPRAGQDGVHVRHVGGRGRADDEAPVLAAAVTRSRMGPARPADQAVSSTEAVCAGVTRVSGRSSERRERVPERPVSAESALIHAGTSRETGAPGVPPLVPASIFVSTGRARARDPAYGRNGNPDLGGAGRSARRGRRCGRRRVRLRTGSLDGADAHAGGGAAADRAARRRLLQHPDAGRPAAPARRRAGAG